MCQNCREKRGRRKTRQAGDGRANRCDLRSARSGQKFRGLPVSKSYEPTERRGPFTPLIGPDGARKTSRFSLLIKFFRVHRAPMRQDMTAPPPWSTAKASSVCSSSAHRCRRETWLRSCGAWGQQRPTSRSLPLSGVRFVALRTFVTLRSAAHCRRSRRIAKRAVRSSVPSPWNFWADRRPRQPA